MVEDRAEAESVAAPASDEAAFVERLKGGDEQAFERLVRDNGPRMLALARRLMRDDESARDVVQDAFLSAFRSMGAFAGGSRLSTWLHRIVVNTALMRLRSRRRRPEEPIEPLLPTFKSDGHHVTEFSAWPDAERSLERREIREIVSRTIDELPESYRAVLLLRDIDGLDTAETARMLELTENAVKIRLHRARQALRTLLDRRFRKGDE
jgi:RNA polymerase sigma-70 factor (ECF subfamily)